MTSVFETDYFAGLPGVFPWNGTEVFLLHCLRRRFWSMGTSMGTSQHR